MFQPVSYFLYRKVTVQNKLLYQWIQATEIKKKYNLSFIQLRISPIVYVLPQAETMVVNGQIKINAAYTRAYSNTLFRY